MQSLAAGAAALALLVPTMMWEPASPLPAPAASICRAPPRAAPAPEVRPVLLEGFGTGGFKVTDNDAAQRWFDQGMATGFAFSHRETLRAFQEAQRLDPSCAMCAWGEAWARGPTINYGVDAAARSSALAVLDRVSRETAKLHPKHRAMIAAMRVRYAEPSRDGRGPADRGYAAEMERLAGVYPSDDELAVLAADALMIAGDGQGEGARDTAEKDGPGAQPRFVRAAALLERVLARNPEHTPAIHFHIHLTEWLGEARKAVAGADKLGRLAPAAGHLVHMPSHTYIRIGRYADAAAVNAAAVQADAALARHTGLDAASEVPYHAHNLHFRTIAAIAAGDGGKALEAAQAYLAAYPLAQNRGGYSELMAASVLFAHARYSDAARIAGLPDAAPNRPTLRAARLYALGEAAARRGDLQDLRSQSAALRVLGREAPRTGEEGQRTRRFTEMARLVLEGRAAVLERRWMPAARSFDRAADLQERLGVDGDPPFFWFNIRRSQAAALTEAGRLEEARTVALKALKDWPNDAPTLSVLAEVHRRAGRPGEAAAADAAARRSWAGDPAELRLSRA